jgi:SWI/SNF-related matrix-associated actin-dependent regulator of chromatin subfamily D
VPHPTPPRQVPLQPLAGISSVVDKVAEDPQIASMEARIAQQVAKINEHRRRRAFYLGFAQSPLDFINSVISSQARDLRVGSGYGAREFEAERRSEVFRQSWVQDAAMRYLQRRSLTG